MGMRALVNLAAVVALGVGLGVACGWAWGLVAGAAALYVDTAFVARRDERRRKRG